MHPAPVPMSRPGDITAKDIAWCAQVDRARRERWASAGRLKRDPPFTERDAAETAIAFALARGGVSQKVAPAAWRRIQPDVKRLLIAKTQSIWILVCADGPRAWAVADASEIAQKANGEGRCWIVSADDIVEEARRRYAELVTHAMPASGHVAELKRPYRDVRRRR
jgi:hypothetical protein